MSSNNNSNREIPSKASAPRSMLANLLSSQQRSAAQSRKHLVQRAMPFANLHKDGSSGNAVMQSFSLKEGWKYSSSQVQNATGGKSEEMSASTDRYNNGIPPATPTSITTDRSSMLKPSVSAISLNAVGGFHAKVTKTLDDSVQQNLPSKKTDSIQSPLNYKDVNKPGQITSASNKNTQSVTNTVGSEITENNPSADTSPKKTKKKEISPFRVKVGCIVAVRFRKLAEGGNEHIVPVLKDGDIYRALSSSSPEANTIVGKDIKDDTKGSISVESQALENKDRREQPKTNKVKHRKPKLFEVWTSPLPGQDFGIALLGRRIRCFYPQSYLLKWQKSHKQSGNTLKRIVEGTVVSIVNETHGHETVIGLLIDCSLLKLRPYLEIISCTDDSKVSDSEQKRRNLEVLIRGKDKVIVKVVLSSVYGYRSGHHESGVAQWVVAKHVLAKPSGLKPTKSERKEKGFTSQSLFIGDKNDTPVQQEDNWRWTAGRVVQPTFDDVDPGIKNTIVASQLFGEVVNMTVCSAQDGSTSLATVIIKRLLAPHQTKSGRMYHHKELELFDIKVDRENVTGVYFQAPVEDVIVIGKRISRHSNCTEEHIVDDWCYTISHSYDLIKDVYTPLSSSEDDKLLHICHHCKRLSKTKHICELDSCNKRWCNLCISVNSVHVSLHGDTWIGPCCSRKIDTTVILESSGSPLKMPYKSTGSYSILSNLVESIHSTTPSNFTLLTDAGSEYSVKPSFIPYCGDGRIPQKRKKKTKALHKRTKKAKLLKYCKVSADTNEDYSIFKPTCCRTLPFDDVKKLQCYTSNINITSMQDSIFSCRENAPARKVVVRQVEGNINTSDRAARASQRRVVKSLTSLGDTKVIDRLAARDREEQLKFGRSTIHGWGVFATKPINTGDLVIEYRGELIGNAVADKRELEYERAKVCDYQFRIDEHIVCDATKVGNVARYINASCSPNCHTQIITANDNKRIVIYAKKNIKAGEELCYDYKFPLEYDPNKRIPCHCKAPNCQGFMNWDKKYVLIDNA